MKLTPSNFSHRGMGMQPTFKPGDYLLTAGASDIRRGDAVIFHPPATVDPARGVVAKRVIGLPGDHVTCCGTDGRVSVNGKPLTEGYLAPGAPSVIPFTVTLKAGQLWVLGDYRDDSLDSREYGPIAAADVVGRITLVWRAGSFISERTPRAFIAAGLAPPDRRPVLTRGLGLLILSALCGVLLVSLGIFGGIRAQARRRRRLVPVGPGALAGPGQWL